MTHNDIAYYEAKQSEARNLETARHNREVEENERRAQRINEAYNNYYLKIAEFRENEQQRHNMASERLNSLSNYLTQLQIKQEDRRIAESERHNKRLEYNDLLGKLMTDTRERERTAETERHNKAMEEQTHNEFEWQKSMDSFNMGKSVFDSGFRALQTAFNGLDVLSRILRVTN
jgi:hypothetical protein